jgi:NDP-sugar pyrophosphorylase family protein
MTSMPTLIILAGGASSRMYPLQEKSLLRFGADPLLLSQLRAYESLGFKRAIIVANPYNVADIQTLMDDAHDGIQVSITIQQEPRGMGDALLTTAEVLPEDASIYITQVHDVVEDNLHADIIAQHHAHPDVTFLAGVQRDTYFPGGYLIIEDDGTAYPPIKGIIEKPGAGNEPSNLVNIVAHLHSSAHGLFEAIRAEYERDAQSDEATSDDHYERAMAHLMEKQPFRVVPYQGRWDALKFPWHTLDIMDRFLERIAGQTVSAGASIAPTATLVGDVFIDEGARVFAGASIVGPAYIGKNTIVGNNALVRNSMVLDNCNVGFTTEIARSYVASGCQMHACRVLDSIFAEDVNFSAGCTTANLRIDKGNVKCTVKGQRIDTGRDKLGAIIGEGAFLSVDVMTMPGVKVGRNAEVGPGTHVRHDIEGNTRVYVKQAWVVEEK